MNIISGNLLDIKKGIIVHQLSNKHVMGAGLAKQIREMYPQHYIDYMSTDMTLGNLVKTHINNKFGIIGMIAQNGYGRDKPYTDYSAFKECLLKIEDLYSTNTGIKYYMPKHIGAGLAGGDWSAIFKLLESYTPFVTLVDFNNK